MLNAGVEIEVATEKPAVGGPMIARHHGQVVLVSGTIPGERVIARIERVQRGVAHAVAVRLVEPHPDRRAVDADWSCGGCVYAHIDYGRQLTLKSEIISDAFSRVGRLKLAQAVCVTASPERGYRMRARLHVRGSRIGFFREGTHELCDAARTGQLLPATNDLLLTVSDVLSRAAPAGVACVHIVENMPADQRVLHVECHPDAGELVPKLIPLGGLDGVTGLTAEAGSGVRLVHGSPYVSDYIDHSLCCGHGAGLAATLQRHALSFFQANRYLVQDLVSHVVTCVPDGPVIDLYSGVGLFAVALAACGRDAVTAVEGDRLSAADLRNNARPFGQAIRVEYAPVENYLRGHGCAPAATVIVDPPRTGLSRDALAAVVACGPARIVYVSCDVATLARDLRALIDGGYELDVVCAFDLFPNTAHIETVVVLTRSKGGKSETA